MVDHFRLGEYRAYARDWHGFFGDSRQRSDLFGLVTHVMRGLFEECACACRAFIVQSKGLYFSIVVQVDGFHRLPADIQNCARVWIEECRAARAGVDVGNIDIAKRDQMPPKAGSHQIGTVGLLKSGQIEGVVKCLVRGFFESKSCAEHGMADDLFSVAQDNGFCISGANVNTGNVSHAASIMLEGVRLATM